MVVTRRGVRVVESPTETNQDESSSATDTATSTRRTRRTAVQEEAQPLSGSKSAAQKTESEVTSAAGTQTEKLAEEATACVENQPEDLHDADVSDSESCCSVVSGAHAPTPRSTRRRGRAETLRNQASGTEGVSEAESCTSNVSTGTATRRSTRSQRKKVPVGAEAEHSEAESCGSVTSLTRVRSRSQRKTPASQASHTEDTEHSEQDCYNLRKSTVRKSTRDRRPKAVVVPIDLEDSGDVSSSSVSRKTPSRRAKATSAEAHSHISEDNDSGPRTRRATRSGAKDAVVRGTSDSESDVTGYSPLGSPCSALGRSTPCSSRTGSASSNRAAPVTRITRLLCVNLARAQSPLSVESQTPNQGVEEAEKDQGDAPLSHAMETEEKMEDVHEATVIVTGEEGEVSLLGEASEEDKTLIAVEEEEHAAGRGVTVSDPAELEDGEGTRTVRPLVVVTGPVCTDTEMAEEGSPVVVDELSEKTAGKGSVTVSEEADERIESGLGSTSTLTAPHAGLVAVTVAEMVEADTTETVAGENDELLTDTDAHIFSDQTVKVTVSEPSDSMVGLDDDMGEVVSMTEEVVNETAKSHIAVEFDSSATQTVKVTICDASESKKEVEDDETVQAVQDADENDKEPTGPDCSCLEPVTEEEARQEEDQPMEVDASESLTDTPSAVDMKVSIQDGNQPSGSGSSQKLAAVSLLDSSDDEDDEDSDMCSLAEEPAGAHQASVGDDDEATATEETVPAKTQPPPRDGLFVIDTQPGLHSSRKYYAEERQSEEQEEDETTREAGAIEEDDEEFVDEEEEEDDEDAQILFTSRDPASKELSCCIDPGLKVKELGGLYINFDGSKSKKVSSSLKNLKDQKHLDELLKKSVVSPDFEKKDSIPPYKESLNASKLKRRVEREKTTGDGWFNMKAPEMTEELKNDLKAIKMRSAMDPKRFYKKNDREGFAKYVQVGTVVDSPLDFYNSRIPKKERKRTIVEELLADAEFRSYNKKKYEEIVSEKAALLAGKKHRKKKFKSK